MHRITTRSALATALTLALGTAVTAAPITFELAETGVVSGTGTAAATATAGTGADALTANFSVSSSNTIDIRSIDTNAGGLTVNGNMIDGSDALSLSFLDDGGFAVAVEILSVEVSRLQGASETAILTIDGASTVIDWDPVEPKLEAFAPALELDAGEAVVFTAGAGTTYRLHSITVEEVVIPEPSSLTLAGIGVAVMLTRRRKNG
ncbi:MAG: PEP-CTERM sorting domain-containing protein [Planctomycetota bacterium]